MVGIRVEVQVDIDVLIAVREAAIKAPRLMGLAYDRALRRIKPRILADIQAAPPPNTPADYPLRWKSQKQRRFVMAKLRRENNLPYQRTGALQKSWRLRTVYSDGAGVLSLESDDPKATFVQGDDQQPMFIDSGWPNIADVITKYDEQLTDILIDTWATVVVPEYI